MFIRETQTINKKTGASYSKYQFVQSYRNERGPRQRIVTTLTELELDKPLWPALALAIAERLFGATSLFESDSLIARYADLLVTKCSIRAKAATANVNSGIKLTHGSDKNWPTQQTRLLTEVSNFREEP